MLNKLIPPDLGGRASAALLGLRVFSGVMLATHGWGKIQDPFHWMDKGADAAPPFFQMLAAVSEFFGGLALAAGALTPLACFGIACTMVVAVHRHLTKGGSFELAGVYLAIAVMFMVMGPGRFSLDELLTRRFRAR